MSNQATKDLDKLLIALCYLMMLVGFFFPLWAALTVLASTILFLAIPLDWPRLVARCIRNAWYSVRLWWILRLP